MRVWKNKNVLLLRTNFSPFTFQCRQSRCSFTSGLHIVIRHCSLCVLCMAPCERFGSFMLCFFVHKVLHVQWCGRRTLHKAGKEALSSVYFKSGQRVVMRSGIVQGEEVCVLQSVPSQHYYFLCWLMGYRRSPKYKESQGCCQSCWEQ